MSLRNIKLVTFDATNTLLKFRVPPWQHYASVAREHGFTGSEDEIERRLLQSFKSTSSEHPNYGRNTIRWDPWWRRVVKLTFQGLLPPDTDVDDIAGRLIEEFKTPVCWCPADSGSQLIRLLREKSIALGVISNFDPRLHEILENVKINKFDFITTSYEVGFSKPDKRIFNCALESLKRDVSPSECMHIGDDLEKDYKGARAAGWHAVLISKLGADPTQIAQPQHVYQTLSELYLAIRDESLKL